MHCYAKKLNRCFKIYNFLLEARHHSDWFFNLVFLSPDMGMSCICVCICICICVCIIYKLVFHLSRHECELRPMSGWGVQCPVNSAAAIFRRRKYIGKIGVCEKFVSVWKFNKKWKPEWGLLPAPPRVHWPVRWSKLQFSVFISLWKRWEMQQEWQKNQPETIAKHNLKEQL